MAESYVELEGFPVLCVRADFRGKGPAEAFDRLEAKLPTLKGRKFYGTFRMTPAGEEYYACVAQLPTDRADEWGFEQGEIAGGLYARRSLTDWHEHLAQLGGIFLEMRGREDVDESRPSVEFYRSERELHLLLPVTRRRA